MYSPVIVLHTPVINMFYTTHWIVVKQKGNMDSLIPARSALSWWYGWIDPCLVMVKLRIQFILVLIITIFFPFLLSLLCFSYSITNINYAVDVFMQCQDTTCIIDIALTVLLEQNR